MDVLLRDIHFLMWIRTKKDIRWNARNALAGVEPVQHML